MHSTITTFGFEDSSGVSGCLDITDFNSSQSFLLAIKEKLLQYNYCFAWGSKSIIRKDKQSGKLEGINADLVTLDSNFKANGIASIIKYDIFTSIPYIESHKTGNNNSISTKVKDIDLLKVFAKPLVKNVIFKNKYKSLHLDEVGKALLGYGKLENKTGAKLDEMSTNERKSYCLQDAHIVAELVRIDNGNILKMMDIISTHTGLKFEEVCHKGMTAIWKKILNDTISKKISLIGYNNLPIVLRKLYSNRISFAKFDDNYHDYNDDEDNEEEDFENGELLLEYKKNSYEQYVELLEQKIKEKNSRPLTIDYYQSNIHLDNTRDVLLKKDSETRYKGGLVLSPRRGLHYNVHVFDVTSLYPTMIINYNISPETINCVCCKNDVQARLVFDKDILKDFQYMKDNDNESSYWICRRKKGLFSNILQQLTKKRIHYKNMGMDVESMTIKAIINSGYGVFGAPYFKYYDPKVAEIVTALGRQTLLEMQKIVNEVSFTILYGDTDSLFISGIENNKDIIKFIDECAKRLKVDVTHEKTFQKLILVAKKHYVGILDDSNKEPVITGMEAIKSDIPEFIQATFKDLIKDIKNNENPIPKLKKAFDKIDKREIPKERLAISLVLGKNPEEYANECLQKRLGIKNGLHKGDLLVYTN